MKNFSILFGVAFIGSFCAYGHEMGHPLEEANILKATSRAVLVCDNGEEVKLSLYKSGPGQYKAKVTVQSVGDSYPSYDFNGIQERQTAGGPHIVSVIVYSSEEFNFVMSSDNRHQGTLNVPSLGIKNAHLVCK